MKTGDIVEATVGDSGEGWGVLTYGEFSSTLMQTELTWKANEVPSVSSFLNGLSTVKVIVTAVSGKKFSCSVKQLEPDPWLNPPKLGEEYEVEIKSSTEYGYFVCITWYCNALLLHKNALNVHKLRSKLSVSVSEVNTHLRRVEVVEIA